MLQVASQFEFGGIGWAYLAFGLAMAWLATQFAWRFAERVAVIAEPRGLILYGMFGRAVPWRDVEAVRFLPGKAPVIEILLKRPRPGLFDPIPRKRHRIGGTETDNGAGAAFAAAAERFRTGVSL